ncbi:hypothetical protein [Microbacterium proteolyticum]|uniref:hypothetical protein n=1 Tax=Microbacterium proteolyticum TaxID=1572644 RepID=UPI001FACF70D|nr:hypothetical protein [Microbacterium proteolyticum]MCI9858202.1 hypothetical protein [Microbacterium proteolyticum]
MRSAFSAARRFSQFAASILLLAASSLWFVRAAIEVGGLSEWASIAVGQTVGAIAAVLIGYGWNIVGPVRVAAAHSEEERQREYVDALVTRAVLVIVASVVVALIVIALPAVDPVLAMLGALPVMMVALSASFYFVGIAQPARLFLLETLPRVGMTSAAALLMSIGLVDLRAGLILQFAGSVLAVSASMLFILKVAGVRKVGESVRARRIVGLLRRQSGGLTSSLLVTAISNAPILIVSVTAPTVLGPFSVVDKLSKQVLAGSSPVTSVLQGWVPRGAPKDLRARARTAVLLAWIAGTMAALAMAVASPLLVHWVSAGEIPPAWTTFALMGAFVGLFLTQNAVSFACLAAQGQLRVANVSLAICSPLGLVLVAFLSTLLGTDGALIGVCAGMGMACVWQTVAVLRWKRNETST